MSDLHRLEPGRPARLADIPTDAEAFHSDKKEAKRELDELRDELDKLQFRFYAEGRRKLLVVFQAMDAGGKDGVVRKVFSGVNAQGVRVTSFKVPTAEELSYDFLWRVHKAAPGAGMIGVFNRSHYEDVLVVRVHRLVPEDVWPVRYEQINQFEKLLADTGTAILKFYLHISKDEQKRRLQARLEEPSKHWKFSADDLEKRRHWDDYMAAYEDVFARCNTPWAPWYVVPADHKWYRNLAVARVLVETLRRLDPQFPPAAEDVRRIVIP